jgi:hypothetical protein
MKYLLSWGKINESKQLKLESIKEHIEDYFLNIMDDPNIKFESTIRVSNYMIKNNDGRFINNRELPSVGDYIEYTWKLSIEGSVDIEDFKHSLRLIDKKIFTVTKEEFETKTRYFNGDIKQKSLILISFIWNEPLKLPKEMDDFIETLKSIGYLKIGPEFISRINLSKEINYKIKTELPIDFIKKIPGNSKQQLESDFVALLNDEINKLVNDEASNIEKHTGSNFRDYLTNTNNDTRPFRNERKIIRIGAYEVSLKIQISIKGDDTCPMVYIKGFKIEIQKL